MTNLMEFLSEAMTNAAFQTELRTVAAPKAASVWQRIVEAVRGFLGLPAEQANALEQVLQSGQSGRGPGASARWTDTWWTCETCSAAGSTGGRS